MKVNHFIIDKSKNSLQIEFLADGLFSNESKVQAELSFEYLRISAPENQVKKVKSAKTTVISHKKDVELHHIESVAKHGFRLIFDDDYQSIYSAEYLKILSNEYNERWQEYLNILKISGHSREAMIEIKQL